MQSIMRILFMCLGTIHTWCSKMKLCQQIQDNSHFGLDHEKILNVPIPYPPQQTYTGFLQYGTFRNQECYLNPLW